MEIHLSVVESKRNVTFSCSSSNCPFQSAAQTRIKSDQMYNPKLVHLTLIVLLDIRVARELAVLSQILVLCEELP